MASTPENLQHQCGGQISCAIDGKQNLQYGGLSLLRVAIHLRKLQLDQANAHFAWIHFRNSWLALSDLDWNRCVVSLQTARVIRSQLRVLEAPQRPIKLQSG